MYIEIKDNKIYELMEQWFESCQSTPEVEKMLYFILKELKSWDEVDYEKLKKYCEKEIKSIKQSEL